MRRRGAELWLALGICVVVTALYAGYVALQGGLPAAGTFVGHSIGMVGFVLMLATETLYSIRKRTDRAMWGSVETWLRAHIVTGLVGPYLVLLHAALSFNGLAGLAMLATGVVVASGVVGRYLYTLEPHATPDAPAGSDAPGRGRGRLASWHAAHVPMTWVLFALAFVHAAAALFYVTFQRWPR